MRYKKIIIMVPVMAVLLVMLAFLVLRITTVRAEGSKMYSEQEIVQSVMNDSYSRHTLWFLLKSRFRGVPCLPFVQEIDVEWKNYNSIVLHVYDKTISGCVKYMGQYVFFDKDGIVLQSLAEPIDGVPVVTGIKFGKFIINQAFEVEDESLFDTIMDLSQLISHYRVKADQIHFEGKDVTLYSGKVQVHLGKREDYDDALAVLASVLEKTDKKNLSGTIDMERFQAGDKVIFKSNTPVNTRTPSETEGGSTEEEDNHNDESGLPER